MGLERYNWLLVCYVEKLYCTVSAGNIYLVLVGLVPDEIEDSVLGVSLVKLVHSWGKNLEDLETAVANYSEVLAGTDGDFCGLEGAESY